MPRKGILKVRTGCATCKIRKVKCDETWPFCMRCTNTGRHCDGYSGPPPGNFSRNEMSCVPPALTPLAKPDELRALGFFRHTVAPVLSGPQDSYFWTHLTIQVTQQEPAARHAVLAVSSLYEHFAAGPDSLLSRTSSFFAARHYNEAIKHLTVATEKTTILVVCLLFICIEFLRGDHEAATIHCRHGILLLNNDDQSSALVRTYLAPVFCRLSIFPLFFGGTIETFPGMTDTRTLSQRPFCSKVQAQESLDRLLVRAVRFVRAADWYRLGIIPRTHLCMSTLRERYALLRDLNSWLSAFTEFTAMSDATPDQNIAYLHLQMRRLVYSTWVEACLERQETSYDAHLDKFETITQMAAEVLSLSKPPDTETQPGKFMFEMGFGPLLYFVAIKCRHLSIRLAALSIMKRLSCFRESLWDSVTLFSVARRIIEWEHGLQLSPNGEPSTGVHGWPLPVDERRIRDSVLGSECDVQPSDNGVGLIRRKASFLVWNPGDTIGTVTEWITIDV